MKRNARKVAAFFRDLDKPVEASEISGSGDDSSRPALGAATIVVGFLLVLAGVLATSVQARWIDITCGLALALFGLVFLRKKTIKTEKKILSQTI